MTDFEVIIWPVICDSHIAYELALARLKVPRSKHWRGFQTEYGCNGKLGEGFMQLLPMNDIPPRVLGRWWRSSLVFQ